MNVWLAVLVASAAISPKQEALEIRGVVVNASVGNSPVAGTTVVLRAEHQGAMMVVAEATTDELGEFQFDGLPASDKFVFLPGANYKDVHYPGVRLRPSQARTACRQTIRVYEPIEAPSPLVATRHEIHLRAETGVLVVTEKLVISNPMLRTYVGKPLTDATHAATLRLSIPPDFAKVTFDKEFFGRQFKLIAGRLETQIPWTPGERELSFTYRLPFESRRFAFHRPLDLRTDHVRIEIARDEIGTVSGTLPLVGDAASDIAVFEAKDRPAGEVIELSLGEVPLPWTNAARWGALGVLVLLVLATVAVTMRRRRAAAQTAAALQRSPPVATQRPAA
jgi:hypothetical protein